MVSNEISLILFRRYIALKCVRNVSTQSNKPIITAKRRYLEFYGRQKDMKRPTVSYGWHSKKSKGDYFIINPTTQINVPEETMSFQELKLANELVDTLTAQNITSPTEIQYRSIPVVLSGVNSFITAETGCGKTLAYLLPLLHQISTWKAYESDVSINSPAGLIITPNRELALQISNVAEPLCEKLDLSTTCVVGGHTKRLMMNPSYDTIDLLIGSFGALSKLFTTKVYKTDRLHHVVLDEADTLLDDSFIEKLTHLLKRFTFTSKLSLPPKGCQLTLASATMPKSIPDELHEFVDAESIKKISTNNLHRILPHVPQRFLRMGKSDKPFELLKLIRSDVKKHIPVMIFSNDTATCNWMSIFLNEQGINCVNFNGKVPIEIKRESFEKFQNGEVNVIVCTDIGSRGLDTTRTKHILNYDFPYYIADYIHRCGRTGRIGSPNDCRITNFIASKQEVDLVQEIELSIRNNATLTNVDANIKKLITRHSEKTHNTVFSSE